MPRNRAMAIRRPRRFFPRLRRRHHSGMKLPIAAIAGFVPGAIKMSEGYTAGGLKEAGNTAGRIYLGFDFVTGKFAMQNLTYGTFPIILGGLVHKFVGGTLGVNRMLGRAGVPFIRL